jgi:hypothetical protein
MAFAIAAPVHANSAYSNKVYYTSSVYQWSYAYISSFADSRGCGSFNSWTRLMYTTQWVSWIRDVANFKSYGLGSISVGSSTGATFSGSDVSVSWTNSNGATGSYISGTVCASWFIVYVGMQSVGSAFYNGTNRITQTPWL